MKFSDVKPRHIYNVIFDDVRECEFDKKHLALVLKKNNDRKTCIVMPLTSEPNGDGVNKIKVGALQCLPVSLRSNETYAVFNQIRTLNVSRFISLKEGSNVIQARVDDALFIKLLDLGTSDITFNLDLDESISFYKHKHEQACMSKVISLAYTISKLKSQINLLIEENEKNPLINDKYSEIERLRIEIRGILSNRIEYTLSEKDIKNGLGLILDDILNGN